MIIRIFTRMNTIALCLLIQITMSASSHANENLYQYHVYLDADMSISDASGRAIRQGIETGLAKHNREHQNQKIKLMIRDHRGNSRRSLKHLKEYLQDPKAIAVFSGLHSPPVLDNLEFINNNQILLLDPWAAAGPITRHNQTNNWVFRASVDDTTAGKFLIDDAIKDKHTRICLVLEDTGWGRSNYNTMTTALKNHGLTPVCIKWFSWNIGSSAAKLLATRITENEPSLVILTANAPEAIPIVTAISNLPSTTRPKVRTHWGITGGNFEYQVDHNTRQKVDLMFLQTNFNSFLKQETELSKSIFAEAKSRFPNEIKSLDDIHPPTGFVHAVDLTRLLSKAVSLSDTNLPAKLMSYHIRKKFETHPLDVDGLIKYYHHPYRPLSSNDMFGHEALSIDDYVMGHYNSNNRIQLTLDKDN